MVLYVVMSDKKQVIVRVQDLSKNFGDKKALDSVSFDVYEGEILGLLGPNGAGKTTIVRVLSTLLKPSGGIATVDDIDVEESPEEVRRHIGFAGQFAAVDDLLTGRQNLDMIGRLYHLSKVEREKRIADVLKKINLEDAADISTKNYSGGMRRRLDLGASLMYTPKVLFLDEPTTGLDPKTRRDLWDTIRSMVDGGVTLLLTTQYLEEADELADRIVLIDKGQKIAEGTPSELKKMLRGEQIEAELTDKSQAKKAAEILGKKFNCEIEIDDSSTLVKFSTNSPVDDLEATIVELKKNKIFLKHIAATQPTLDDVFLELTDKAKKDA